MTRTVKLGLIVATAAPLFVLAAGSVLAAGETLLGGKLRAGDTIAVPANETVEGDLYLFGGTLTVDGTVDGDLVAFGGTIDVNGEVTGDVIASGGTVSIDGTVGGDLRVAGGQLTAGSAVGEDMLAGGGQVTVSSRASIGGDLIVGGGTVAVDGSVSGSIVGSAGSYSRSGPVGGTEEMRAAPQREPAAETGNAIIDALRHFVVALLLGALALWLVPRAVRAGDAALRNRPLASLGGGVAALIGYVVLVIAIVIVMILLAIVSGLLGLGALVGIDVVAGLLAIGVTTFGFALAVAFVADIVVGLALARLVAPGEPAGRWQELGLLAAGLALVVIVTSVPIIGGLVKLAVVLFGLGALAVVAWRFWRLDRSTPGAVESAS